MSIPTDIIQSSIVRNERNAMLIAKRLSTTFANYRSEPGLNFTDQSDVRHMQREVNDFVAAITQVIAGGEMLEDIDDVTKEGA